MKVNHSNRLKVTGQGEILASQDFDCGHRSTYSARICDIPLLTAIFKHVQNIFSGIQVGTFIKDDSIYNMMIVACQAIASLLGQFILYYHYMPAWIISV